VGKRRVIRLLIYCLILLGLLTGCFRGQDDHGLNPKKPVSLEIWHYYNGPLKMIFDNLIMKFNETVGLEKGIIIDAFSQGNVDDLERKVLKAVINMADSEQTPDMFAAYPDTAYLVDQLGHLVDLEDYLSPDEIEQYIASYIEEGRLNVNGGLKIFPIAKATEVMMVNKTDWDKFAEVNDVKLEDLETWEGLAKTAEKYYQWTDSLTPTPNDGKAFFGRDAMTNYIIVGSKQLGKEIFSVEDGQVSLNIDPTIMRRLWDSFYIPYVNGYYNAVGKFRSEDVKIGEIIALVCSTSGIGYFPDRVITDHNQYDIESVTLPLPNFEDTAPYAVQQGAGMAVLKSSKTQEYACVEFLKWFTGKERNIEFAIKSGYMPVKKESNQIQVIEEYAANSSDEIITNRLQNSLPSIAKQLQSYELYTSKPFDKGTEVRNVIGSNLIDKAKIDRAEVISLINQGYSRQEAVGRFTTDENFNRWLREFTRALEDILYE